MKSIPSAASSLRVIAVASFLLVLGLWVATGAHRGWTQTEKITLHHDEITGIDFPVHEKTFVAGVEILLVGAGFSAALAGASLLFGRPRRA